VEGSRVISFSGDGKHVMLLANKELKWVPRLALCLKSFDPERHIQTVFPPPKYCTGTTNFPQIDGESDATVLDNAVMIAWASMSRFLAQDYDDYGIELRAKWSIEDLHKEGL